MKILLIEDETNKITNIKLFIKNTFKTVKLDIAKSYTTAIKHLGKTQYDLILLDMSLPFSEIGESNFDYNEFETFGGINILDELDRINYAAKVLVVTAFDILGENEKSIKISQLHEQMMSDYPGFYIGYIHYNSSSIEWKNKLKTEIQKYT